MAAELKTGYAVGNGAALNVELGFIPDRVDLYNLTDGDLITTAVLGGDKKVVPFSSGGTTEIAAGNTITGATSGATARVSQVLLYSGTWAGGDAAGFFVVTGVSGTFGSENVDVGSDTNLATVTADVNHNLAISTAVASATGDSAISKYDGATGTNSLGFTIGATIAEEAKLLYYVAMRGGE